MDGIAAKGMVFTRAYSSSPLCMPYRNSMFTGRYPHETGVTTNSSCKEFFAVKVFNVRLPANTLMFMFSQFGKP